MSDTAKRNRAIKKLLEDTWGKGIATVTGDRGTAHGWVNITFARKPDLLIVLCPSQSQLKGTIEALCKEAGIELFYYNGDMPGERYSCLSLNFPRGEG